MTFTEVHLMYLQQMDDAYMRVKRIMEDPKHLNDNSGDYKRAMQDFNDVLTMIWQLKNFWYRVSNP